MDSEAHAGRPVRGRRRLAARSPSRGSGSVVSGGEDENENEDLEVEEEENDDSHVDGDSEEQHSSSEDVEVLLPDSGGVRRKRKRAEPELVMPQNYSLIDVDDADDLVHGADSSFVPTPQPINWLNPPTPLEVFECFFPPDVVGRIVAATNAYVAEKPPRDGSRQRQWRPVTREYVYYYLSCLRVMGYARLPALPDYWSTMFGLQNYDVKSIMTYRKLRQVCCCWCAELLIDSNWSQVSLMILQMKTCFHLVSPQEERERRSADEAAHAPGNKVFKVEWLFQVLNASFKANYSLARDVSVDEMVVLFKGRHTDTHVFRHKPIKGSFKVFALCEALTGYSWHLILDSKSTNVDQYRGNKTSGIVMGLVRQLRERAHHIYMDNYFSSVDLFQGALDELGQFICGTARMGRLVVRLAPDILTGVVDDGNTVRLIDCRKHFPSDLKQVLHRRRLKKDSLITTRVGDVTAGVWIDNGPVTFLTTIHNCGHGRV